MNLKSLTQIRNVSEEVWVTPYDHDQLSKLIVGYDSMFLAHQPGIYEYKYQGAFRAKGVRNQLNKLQLQRRWAAVDDGPKSSSSTISLPALRKAASVTSIDEALEILLSNGINQLDEIGCRELLLACIDRSNVQLAQAIYQAMTASSAGLSTSSVWPSASTETASLLTVGFCRSLNTNAAIQIIETVRNRGLPLLEDVHFGFTVGSPADPTKPLCVMQPQEGVKTVLDSYSRYQFEIFSGTVTSAASEALVSGQTWVDSMVRTFGLIRRQTIGAIHTLTIENPSGNCRSFKFGTDTADVPAKLGDRLSVVCAPQEACSAKVMFLRASPPNTKPGEPLAITNHTTNTNKKLLRPSTITGLPNWFLPGIFTLVFADVASSMIDPSLPLIGAGAVIAAASAIRATDMVLLPALKQLPLQAIEQQATRQSLLSQRSALERRVTELTNGAIEDVRTLARLWQLSAKMATLAAAGAYDSRKERVHSAKNKIEERLRKNIELIDGYARVMNMIEIEVEMETEVPQVELAGIQKQIEALNDIEELQAEWRLQSEAQDEVERLLRAG